MSPKTILYISLLILALLVLAVGGWLAKGVRRSAELTKQAPSRPRFA